MLPADVRMRKSGEFAATVRHGRREGARTVVLHSWCPPDPQENTPRVGFVVSKKVGSAVVRNRTKRRLRHLVRQRLADPDLDLPANLHLVVRALPPSATHPERLAPDVERVWSRSLRKWDTSPATRGRPVGSAAGDRS